MAAPLLAPQSPLAPPEPLTFIHRCGAAVAVDEEGRTVVVGSPGADSFAAIQSGAVHVLDGEGRVHARLVAEDAIRLYHTGSQVAISPGGRWIAVSASRQLFGSPVVVVLFERVVTQTTLDLPFDSRIRSSDVTNWVQRTMLQSPNDEPSFGAALAFKRDRDDAAVLAVGQPSSVRGRVWLYSLQNDRWLERGSLRPGGPQVGSLDAFGQALSFAGDVLAVGAPNTSGGQGQVHLFRQISSPWQTSLIQQIPSSSPAFGDRFGESLTLTSSTGLLVGAPGTSGNSGAIQQFKVFGTPPIFRHVHTVIGQPWSEPGGRFGAALSSWGDIFVVGGPGVDDGRAYWGEFGGFLGAVGMRPEIPNPYFLDELSGKSAAFGTSVASSADVAGSPNRLFVVGAPGARAGSGGVLITRLRRDPEFNIGFQTVLQNEGRDTPAYFDRGSRFGAVALDGDTLVVGMPQDRNTGRWRGGADVYQRQNGVWMLSQRLAGDAGLAHGDFGAALALQGNRLAVGAPGINSVDNRRGTVFLFERVNGVWQRQGNALEGPPGSDEAWGSSLALWGSDLAVGAPGANNRQGRVTTFQQQDSGQWQSNGEIRPPFSGTTNAFGASLVMRDETLIVGEPGGLGCVHVYGRNGQGWSSLIKSLSAEPKSTETGEMQRGGAFGAALAFDGQHLAVGQPDMRPELSTARKGRVHLYSATNDWNWVQVVSAEQDQDRFGEALVINGDNLLVGAPGIGRTYLYHRTAELNWTREYPGNDEYLSGPAGSEFGVGLALGSDHLLVASPAAPVGGLGTGTIIPYQLNYTQTELLAGYVRDLLYPRRAAPGGVRNRENAAFDYLSKLYEYDPEDTQRRVRILPERISDLWTDVQQARADNAERMLLGALTTLYSTGQTPGTESVRAVEELLLDLHYERSAADNLISRLWLRDVERQRLEGHPTTTGFVIELEIPAYRRIVSQESRALEAYFRLFRSDLMPGRPDLGEQIFTAWVPSRNLRSPIVTDRTNDTEEPVAGASQVYSGGYQDLTMLYGLLRDRAEHTRTLVELLWADGSANSLAEARTNLANARMGLFMYSALLDKLIPSPPDAVGQANGLTEARAGVTRELNRLEAIQTQMDLGLTPLGYDPTILLLYQNTDSGERRFNSFDSFLDYMEKPGSPLQRAIQARDAANESYDTYRDRRDQFEDQLQRYNTAYDDRLYDIWGKHLREIRDGEDPRSNEGGGIWSAWKSVEEARNRMQRSLIEITNLHERINIEVDRRGKERDINDAIGKVHIKFANRQAQLTESLGHIEAAQAGFNEVMESVSADEVTTGGLVLGLVKGAGNALAEEAKTRHQAQKERLAGLEQAEIIALDDQLLDAASKVLIKNLLLDIQAALLDCEQANILLEQSLLGQYQALVDEGYDLMNRIRENNVALSGRYFADPIHALRARRDLAEAHLEFSKAQRWVFFLARALEYKWNEQIKLNQPDSRNLSLSSVFRARNANELDDLVNAFKAHDQLQQLQRTEGQPFDYFSVREDFFGYNRLDNDSKPYTDPETGAPTDALGAFRSRLRQSLREGEIQIRFNTVRTKRNFFRGPEFCAEGLPKSQRHQGTYLNKIVSMAVFLQVSRLEPRESRTATGTLTYSGTSYVRNREVGRPSTERPDLVLNEMTGYPVRRWYQDPNGYWLAKEGLVFSALTMPKYEAHHPPDDAMMAELPESQRITAFKERPVAATDWVLTIRPGEVNLDTLEDIYIGFRHVSAERLHQGHYCQP